MELMKDYIFTSESVCEGHPDKVADQISDGVLDELLSRDPDSRVACEVLVTTGMAFVSGEITTKAYVDIPKVVRRTIKDIGYTDARMGFDYQTCAVVTSIDEQSPDIAMGVDQTSDHEQGAGDQGIMFGYACSETETLMPLPISMAQRLAMRLSQVRKDDTLDYLRPDGKTQVSVVYKNDRPKYISTIVLAAQHSPETGTQKIKDDIIEEVIKPTIPKELIRDDTKFLINTTGRFVVGGPQGDCGLTGRKIIVDTYGGVGSHGGGCFSGKDPSKVDRSASYMARHIAKNVVAAELAKNCEVQLAYAIGVAEPVSVYLDCKGTNSIKAEKICECVKEVFDLRPRAIIDYLDLKRPIYKKTAAYGHFGREEPEFTWEKTNKVDELRDMAGL
ncbi:MAG TPA: methionine adenosyltransferase [Candidatus Methanofastidiosa archaeon]|nr:methionine adenosyltransferase [Candidatus Methanofastidiosa archaeon]